MHEDTRPSARPWMVRDAPLITTPVHPKTQRGWAPCSLAPPGSQLQRQQSAGTQDAGGDPQHTVTRAHQRTWRDPIKTSQTK